VDTFTVKSVRVFGQRPDSARFTSPIDSKGRALVSADIRRGLRLKFGTPVEVAVGESKFSTKVDERGRFSVPARLREKIILFEATITRRLK